MTESAGSAPPPEGATEAGAPPGARRALDWARKFELVSVIVVALLSPLLAGAGIWYSNSQIREQLRISSEGQITDRYTKAVENLGAEAVDVRLGGIYALQRIMEDSPRDHPTVANVLATYIRTHTTKPPKESDDVAADVSAALTVLAHRDHTRDGTFWLDLRYAHLPDIELLPLSDGTPVNLSGAELSRANLSGAALLGAHLTDAHLSGAELSEAYLSDANLTGAKLTHANLSDAYLSDARLTNSDLDGANLTGANLTGADLTRAELTDAVGLTVQQLMSARIDQSTKLPPQLAKDPALKAHIADNE